jgi:hypothetical protein
MKDPIAVYRVIEMFLLCLGYDSEKWQKGVEDGHMMLYWIDCISKDNCYNNDNGTCVYIAFDRLFKLLENGSYWCGVPLVPGHSLWTRKYTNAALRAGGYPPKGV